MMYQNLFIIWLGSLQFRERIDFLFRKMMDFAIDCLIKNLKICAWFFISNLKPKELFDFFSRKLKDCSDDFFIKKLKDFV